MRFEAVSVLSTAFIVVLSSGVPAQGVSGPSRFSFGGDVVVSQPKGEFATNVPNGYGLDATGMFRIDPQGWFNIRADIGGVQYGRETQTVAFPNTGRIALHLETDNRIGFGSIGTQVQFPDGWIRPYANAALALTTFWTESSLSGTDGSFQTINTTNHSDWSHAWVFGGGVTIPFGKSMGALNMGARYNYGARATYLRKGDIIDQPDGSVVLNLRNSKTDLVLWQLGVSFVIPRSTRQ